MKTLRRGLLVIGFVLVLGLFVPQPLSMPVLGATSNDWNAETFWYEPWGRSGVHKGVDIFAASGTAVVAPTAGLVVSARELPRGGRIVLLLTSKWRLHYFAHLESSTVSTGDWLNRDQPLGTVGTSGNAAGKAPHLHYAIVSAVPLPWRIDGASQGWKKAFYLDPTVLLAGAAP